eukprot:1651271-Amphidinium_carterae.1
MSLSWKTEVGNEIMLAPLEETSITFSGPLPQSCKEFPLRAPQPLSDPPITKLRQKIVIPWQVVDDKLRKLCGPYAIVCELKTTLNTEVEKYVPGRSCSVASFSMI